jgi:hypothetical protein
VAKHVEIKDIDGMRFLCGYSRLRTPGAIRVGGRYCHEKKERAAQSRTQETSHAGEDPPPKLVDRRHSLSDGGQLFAPSVEVTL